MFFRDKNKLGFTHGGGRTLLEYSKTTENIILGYITLKYTKICFYDNHNKSMYILRLNYAIPYFRLH